MCSGFTTSPSIGTGSGSTATGSSDNSSCTSPQPQMTSSTELNNSCASLAGHSINQKMSNLNKQFLTGGDFGGKASEIISSSFNDNNSNVTLTSSVESSGIASASKETMYIRGDEERKDSSCYTHSQCTPDECWIMVSRSSFLTDKQNSDADLCSKSNNLGVSQSNSHGVGICINNPSSVPGAGGVNSHPVSYFSLPQTREKLTMGMSFHKEGECRSIPAEPTCIKKEKDIPGLPEN